MGRQTHLVLVTVLGIVGLLSGCATPYKASGLMGRFGYSDIQIDHNTVKVSFRGNAVTSKDTVETYLLFRCAEVTVEKGYDWFATVSESGETKQGTLNTPGYYTGSGNTSGHISGNSVFATTNTQGTYFPSQTINFRMFGASAVIKMFKGEKPEDALGAYDAREVVKFMGPKIHQK